MTAGMAANRPMAVASSASAMPGATTARFVVCISEIPMKLFMMPHTVPNSPTNGEVAAMVASAPMPNRMRRDSDRATSEKLDATRSLMPASLSICASADNRASLIAAATKLRMTLRSEDSADNASFNVRALETALSAETIRRLEMDSSMNFPMNVVQVTSEANARLTMIACATRLADRNIDHGDNSRSPTATALAVATPVSFTAPVCASVVDASFREMPG